MNEDIQWTIAELLVRYELEPQLVDVFVEGVFDKEVLSHAFRVTGLPHSFYEIETVCIPPAILAKHGLTSGNKQRVIALSREFQILEPDAKVLCLADRDLDHWFGTLETSRRLRWTVYCSIDSHFLTKDIIRDVLVTTGRARIADLDVFLESVFHILKALYALRLSDRENGYALKWVALKKYLTREGNQIVFDAESYSTAVLNTNAKLPKKATFMRSVTSWASKLNCDVRLASQGHDYCELLAWSMAEFGGQKEFRSKNAVKRLFVLLSRSIETIPMELQ